MLFSTVYSAPACVLKGVVGAQIWGRILVAEGGVYHLAFLRLFSLTEAASDDK